MSLCPGRVHVLGDVLSQAPRILSPKLQIGTFTASNTIFGLSFGEH